ncbi:MAG: nucleoside-triphosphatase [Treponema sp.]
MCGTCVRTEQYTSAKRIFFVTGERGVGKSTFLTAVIEKFALRPSGFITQKKDTEEQSFLYIHPVIDGVRHIRYSAENCVGICRKPRPAGYVHVFDSYGVKVLHNAFQFISQARNTEQQCILMDELGTMESGANLFCGSVYRAFTAFSVIGTVKPEGTVFLPLLQKIPSVCVFRLTVENRMSLYKELKQAQSFEEFLYAVR